MLALKTNRVRFILLLACFTLGISMVCTQSPGGAVAAKIDSLFKPYDTQSGPGAVVAVVWNDSVLFKDGDLSF